jgi:hypothetical protein
VLAGRRGTRAACQTAGLVVLVCASTLGLSACGEADREVAKLDANPSGVALIGSSDLERLPRGSAEQAFIEYWSSLQFQAWPQAAAFYAPAVRNRVGPSGLTAIFAAHSSYFRAAEPRLVLSVPAGGLISIYYYVVGDPQGGRAPRSVTFRKTRGRWVIVHDSFLGVGSKTVAPRRQLGKEILRKLKERFGRPFGREGAP